MRPRIVLFGDSLTEQSFRPGGWGASLADAYSRKADIVVRGYGGYNSRWALFLLDRIFPNGFEDPPVAATVFFGANDAALLGRASGRQHVPILEYKENLRKIVCHLKKLSPNILVVLITPPPIDETGRRAYARSIYGENAAELPERTNETTGVYARQCVELANEMSVPCVNIWSKMQETAGWQKLLSDGLHFTAEGNAVLYDEVIKVLFNGGLHAPKMAYDFPHHSEIDPQDPQKSFN
ncbi:unnamed protein product [Victoria cruziana]